MGNLTILPNQIKINNLCIYLLIVFAVTLACRLILCFFKMLAIKQGEADYQENGRLKFDCSEVTYFNVYLKSFLSNSGHRTIDDYWLPAIVGFVELIVYPILMVSGFWTFIGTWLGIKIASQWGSWQKTRTAYNRFLLGNVIVLFVSYLFLTPFVEIIK